MATSQHSDDTLSPGTACKLAKMLAPEDICAGEFVARLYEVMEYASLIWCDDAFGRAGDELIRVQYTPENGGEPLKVKSVCLPFVLVKSPTGQRYTLDVRRVKLARLDNEFAEIAWKMLRQRRPKPKQKKSRK